MSITIDIKHLPMIPGETAGADFLSKRLQVWFGDLAKRHLVGSLETGSLGWAVVEGSWFGVCCLVGFLVHV